MCVFFYLVAQCVKILYVWFLSCVSMRWDIVSVVFIRCLNALRYCLCGFYLVNQGVEILYVCFYLVSQGVEILYVWFLFGVSRR